MRLPVIPSQFLTLFAREPHPKRGFFEPKKQITSIAQKRPGIDLEVNFDYNSAYIGSKAIPQVSALGQALSSPKLKGGSLAKHALVLKPEPRGTMVFIGPQAGLDRTSHRFTYFLDLVWNIWPARVRDTETPSLCD
jgi:hypothetical protein